MSFARTRTIFNEELARTLKRPLFWFLIFLVGLMTWGLSTGHLHIASGDSSVGGTKAWVTSEFAFARALMALMAMLYGFFGSIAAGMAVVADDEAKVSDMLLSTPLRPAEYVWGKFLAILAGFLCALGTPRALRRLLRPRAAQCGSEGHPWAVPPVQLSAAGPGVRAADAGLLPGSLLLPGRALAAAGHGLPLPHRPASGVRLLPLELDAHLARPADQPAADVGRPLRLPLDQRDLDQARPGSRVLQQGPHRDRPAVPALAPGLPRDRPLGRGAGPASPRGPFAGRNLGRRLEGMVPLSALPCQPHRQCRRRRGLLPPLARGPADAHGRRRALPGDCGGGRHGAQEPPGLPRPLPLRRADPRPDPGEQPGRPGRLSDRAADYSRGGRRQLPGDSLAPPLPAAHVLHGRVDRAGAVHGARRHLLLHPGADGLAAVRQGARQQRGGIAHGGGHLPGLRHRHSHPGEGGAQPHPVPAGLGRPAHPHPARLDLLRHRRPGSGRAALPDVRHQHGRDVPQPLLPIHGPHELGRQLVDLGDPALERHERAGDGPPGPRAQPADDGGARRLLYRRGGARLRPAAGGRHRQHPPARGCSPAPGPSAPRALRPRAGRDRNRPLARRGRRLPGRGGREEAARLLEAKPVDLEGRPPTRALERRSGFKDRARAPMARKPRHL